MKLLIEIIFSTQDLVDIIKPIDVNDVDKIVIVAFSSTEKIEEYLEKKKVNYEVIGVEDNFEFIAKRIAEYISKNKGKEFLVNLINVPTLFVVATIMAFLLSGVDAELVFSYYSIRVKELASPSIKLEKDYIEILKALDNDYVTLPEISKEIGLPITTTWRRLNDLINEEIITKDYKLTRKGRVLKAALAF